MKLSTRRKSTAEEGDENKELIKLSADDITSIFIRCPVKTLSVLRCVSKSWSDLIISPLFVHSHLEQSMENAQLLFLGRKQSERCKLRFVSVDMEGKRETNELYTVTVPDLTCCYWIVCSGLVCLSMGRRVHLCNPAMQQVYELPKCAPTAFPERNYHGFGYLHSKKEYKVVHIFYTGPKSCHGDLQLAQLRCEVFTLKEFCSISNQWKEIAEMPPYHPSSLPGLVVNECMYWLVRALPHTIPDRIVSFDFENENFLTISFPSPIEINYGLKLMDLKGMLCLPDMPRFCRSSGSVLDLWVLKDKINCFWVEEYSINLVNFGGIHIMPIFWTWNEEIIFIHSDMVSFYDLRRKCCRGVKRPPTTGFGGIYRESLLSLRRV